MNIIALVTGPFYPGQTHGGSHRILDEVLTALSNSGHEVTLLCGRGAKDHPVYIHNGATIKPILQLKRRFPNPWSINLSELTNIMEVIREHTLLADVVYNHDSQFLWCFDTLNLFGKKRVVCSIRDFVYEDSLRGLFSMQRADCVIANSVYSYQVISHLNKNYNFGVDKSLVCIENGIDLDFWQGSEGADYNFRSSFGIKPSSAMMISPVRPELNKGILEALAILISVVESGIDAHLVICDYVDDGFPYMERFLKSISDWRASNKAASNRLHVVPWLQREELRSLYREADVTLCAGTYPEAFGSNVYAESVASGTPCVCCMAGAMRTTFPKSTSFQFYPKDIDGAVREVKRILHMNTESLLLWKEQTATIIHDRYSIRRMREEYVNAISGLAVVCASRKIHLVDSNCLPWQLRSDDGTIYDDIEEEYLRI